MSAVHGVLTGDVAKRYCRGMLTSKYLHKPRSGGILTFGHTEGVTGSIPVSPTLFGLVTGLYVHPSAVIMTQRRLVDLGKGAVPS